MTKIWVLTADTTTDVEGMVLSEGKVIGVFDSEAAAEKHWEENIVDSYTRRKHEYTIESFDISE